jgi:hypothetical protein
MAAATASKELGLGAPYARPLRIEVKGDDANVDDNTTFALTDDEGRAVLTAVAIDAGDADAGNTTGNGFSTVGAGYALVNDEARSLLSSGAVGTDNVGGGPIIAKSPLTIDVAAGTSGDVFEVTVFVEV